MLLLILEIFTPSYLLPPRFYMEDISFPWKQITYINCSCQIMNIHKTFEIVRYEVMKCTRMKCFLFSLELVDC